MTKVTLSFELESLYPRPELMPPNGREIILRFFKHKLKQYEAEELLGWKRGMFNDYLASIIIVADREIIEESQPHPNPDKKEPASNFIKDWEQVIKRM